MEESREYEDGLYYVWGFHGLLLVDAISHTEAQDMYCGFHQCDSTMIEHCMMVPDPGVWASRRGDPDVALSPHGDECGAYDRDECEPCRAFWALHPFPSTVVDPADPRLNGIDVEVEKTALEARMDQRVSWSRENDGYWHGPEPVDLSKMPDDPG